MPFPLQFDPATWQGPRAGQYDDRSDAFQQLVGDMLRERYGTFANVAPTEGRDGSIDAFIEGVERGLGDLTTAQIVECKDHDDTLNQYLGNIDQGWALVAKKLQKQAEAGWPGHYQPWTRARSYAYGISAVLPNQQARDALHQRIRDFFDQLPAHQKPPIETIRVFDWSDLRDLLDRCPRLADQWLGARLPLIPGHAEHCASLTRFRRYLLSSNLPFVPPEAGAESAPQAILDRLEALAGGGGVVLSGVGGIGKTRTSLEVGHLAHASGWRVLHALPGEPGVTIEDLKDVVLDGDTKTLVIFDYLDQMPGLDLGTLRRRLLPEAEKRGLRLALLGNLRPSALRTANPERDALFTEQILLRPSERQTAEIAEHALDRIARLAVTQLGRERVRELCGERPIITMLIAEELQRRALNNTLTTVDLAGLRRGDLVGWLRKRLTEDGLVVAAGAGFLPPQPEPALIAAAAMLAAAPLEADEMQAAGATACQAAGGDGSRTAVLALRSLGDLGWLEPHAGYLTAAHDVVADEVLTEVLWERHSGRLREDALAASLAPALERARVLGRNATALTRLLGPEAMETPRETALRTQAGDWLRSHALPLGRMLAAADASESAYAMGGMVSAPAWTSVCAAEWSPLIAPWLARHGTHVQARHLLYRGLKQLPEGEAPDLLAAALQWLPRHLGRETANYVLAPLLARSDLGEHAPRTTTFALDWLQAFGHTQDARFVFPALLERSDLGEHAPRTIAFAMDWLQTFGQTQDAQFVFHELLGRSDLGEHDTRAIGFAVDWLQTFGHTQDARFVFPALLERSDLGEHAPRAIGFAVDWLQTFAHTQEARFVFPALLGRSDLGEHAPRTIAFAVDWLQTFAHTQEAGFVFPALLGRSDLGEHDARAIGFAVSWLQTFGQTQDAQFVFNTLLGRSDLGAHETLAIALAMAWLGAFALLPEAEFVLKRMFGLTGLSPVQRSRCVAMAVAQLDRLGHSPEASHLLKGCLSDRDLDPDSAGRVTRYALDWLKANPDTDGTDFVFNRLLNRPDFPDTAWADVSQIALDWLRQHSIQYHRDMALAALLRRPQQLPHADLRWVLHEAQQWLENPPRGARRPDKLLGALRYFHREYDPDGELFPIEVLARWQSSAPAGLASRAVRPSRTD